MKIDNRTRWRTEDLRYMIGQALRERGVPSKGVEVTIRKGRRPWPNGIAGRGRFEPTFVRRAGASLVRGPVFLKPGRSMWVTMPDPPAKRAKTSETKWQRRVAALERQAKK